METWRWEQMEEVKDELTSVSSGYVRMCHRALALCTAFSVTAKYAAIDDVDTPSATMRARPSRSILLTVDGCGLAKYFHQVCGVCRPPQRQRTIFLEC